MQREGDCTVGKWLRREFDNVTEEGIRHEGIGEWLYHRILEHRVATCDCYARTAQSVRAVQMVREALDFYDTRTNQTYGEASCVDPLKCGCEQEETS